MSAPVGYREIRDDLLQRISSGRWKPGSPIPSEAMLALEFDCSRGTINRAMRELSEQGVVERKRKAGSRVTLSRKRQAILTIPLIRQQIEAEGKAYRYALLDRRAVAAPAWLKAKLDLANNADVLHLHCLHFAGNRAHQFEDRWINLAAVSQAAQTDFSKMSPNEWLVAAVPLSQAEFAFSATAADKSLSKIFDVPVGAPLFAAERTTWLDGEAITFARITFHQGYRLVTGG